MTDQEVRQEDAMERIQIMLHQEEHVYSCPDYFSPSYRSQRNQVTNKRATTTPLTVVEECAKLVTDLSISSSNSDEQQQQQRCDAQSPNDVVRGPSSSPSSSSNAATQVPRVKDAHLIPWRCQMCAWAYTVVDTFGFHVSVVATAFNILDRYLAEHEPIMTRQDFQLFSMTAVYLAVKITEPSSHQKLTLDTVTDMSRGFFSIRDFEDTELDMLMALKWRVSPPTAFSFVNEFHKLLPCSIIPLEAQQTCRELLARSVGDAFFVPRKASHVAVAAIMIVLQDNNDKAYELLTSLVPVEDDEFQEIYKHLKR